MSDSGAGSSAVYVVGAINVDLVVAADRLPRPGETVVGPEMRRHGGGKGANSAVAAARAGAHVHLIGAVGSDMDGAQALDDLNAEGVDVTGVAVLEESPTGVALIVVDGAGENQIAVGAGANAAVPAAHVRKYLRDHLTRRDVVLVSTEIPGVAAVEAVRSAVAAGARCILNPAPPLPEIVNVLSSSVVLTPNAGECRVLAQMVGIDADPAAAIDEVAAAVARATGSTVAVTLGRDGALVVEGISPPARFEPWPAEVRDTTGAGDTFNGVLAARWRAGDNMASALVAAGAAAALSVESVGARAGMPYAAQIEARLTNRPEAAYLGTTK